MLLAWQNLHLSHHGVCAQALDLQPHGVIHVDFVNLTAESSGKQVMKSTLKHITTVEEAWNRYWSVDEPDAQNSDCHLMEAYHGR